jgi:hypothetical protein
MLALPGPHLLVRQPGDETPGFLHSAFTGAAQRFQIRTLGLRALEVHRCRAERG